MFVAQHGTCLCEERNTNREGVASGSATLNCIAKKYFFIKLDSVSFMENKFNYNGFFEKDVLKFQR